MKVSRLIELLGECDPDARVILSGDPEIFGDGFECWDNETAPTVRNLGVDGRYVIIWPDRHAGETEPWEKPEDIDPSPQPVLKPKWHKLDISGLSGEEPAP